MKATGGQYWWQVSKNELAKSIDEHLSYLANKQGGRSEANLKNLRLYGNTEIAGLRSADFAKAKTPNRLTLNVVQMCVDTSQAKIAKNKPKPRFLTDGGNFSLYRKAENLERFIGGVWYQNDHYCVADKVYLDGGVFGSGFIHFYWKDDKLCEERVYPQEIVVDEDESMFTMPRSMHRVKYVNKEVLKAKYPKYAIQIDAAATIYDTYLVSVNDKDMVRLVESWHLPSGKDAKDGRHTITIKNASFLDEKYTYDYFPFEKWDYKEQLIGYYGQGIAEMLQGIQYEINKTLRTIQLSMHLGSVPKIFLEKSSKVVKQHLNNQIGGIITFSGTKPTYEQLMAVPPELWTQLSYLYEKAFEVIGISQMGATSQKAPGLVSGVSIREAADIETERFAVLGQRWEKFHMNCVKKMLRMYKDRSDDVGDIKITAMDKNETIQLKWKDVNMAEDSYILKVYPSNLLRDTPAGRLDDVTDMMNSGLFTRQQGLDLLDFPDIESITSLENAAIRDIKYTIEAMVEKGEYNPPEPFQDLELGVKMCQASYLKFKRMNVTEANLELLRTWIDEAMALLMPPEEDPMLEEEIMSEEMPTEEDLLALTEGIPEEIPA